MYTHYVRSLLLVAAISIPTLFYARPVTIVNTSPFDLVGEVSFCEHSDIKKMCSGKPVPYRVAAGKSVVINGPQYRGTRAYSGSSSKGECVVHTVKATVNADVTPQGNRRREEKTVSRDMSTLNISRKDGGAITTVVIHASHYQTYINDILMVQGLAIYNFIQ